jgi:hypothetical protein
LLIAIAICTVVAALVGISVARDDSGRMTVVEHLVQWGVVYHGAGFVILDQELRRPDGLLQSELTLGRSTVSGLERYVVFALRRVDRSLTPVGSTTGSYLDEFRPIGNAGFDYPLMANAFGTSLFSLYLDAREVGVLFGSFGFGLFLGVVFRTWKAHGSAADYALLIGLTVGGWMSVFQSQLDSPRYWLLVVTWMLLQTIASGARTYQQGAGHHD